MHTQLNMGFKVINKGSKFHGISRELRKFWPRQEETVVLNGSWDQSMRMGHWCCQRVGLVDINVRDWDRI